MPNYPGKHILPRTMLAIVILLLLGCGGLGAMSASTTQPDPIMVEGKSLWQCPTPVPIEQTTIALNPLGTTTIITDTFPTATPYYRSDFFFLGQDIYAGPLRLTIWSIEDAGPASTANGGIIRVVDAEIASTIPMPLDLSAQLVIREVRSADGSGPRGFWRSDSTTQVAYNILPTQIQPGQSWRGKVAIRTPAGTPTLLYFYRTPADAQSSQAVSDGVAIINITGDPFCTENIARQPGGPGGLPPIGTPGIDRTPLAVPPGQNALVAFAVAHVGYPYVWGAKGPNAFDCSGLVFAAYQSIGISIPAGTRGGPAPGQGYYGTAINVSELRPGDAVFFATVPGDQPTHVAMYVGDLNGDGKGDLIEAASPTLGVIFTSNWLDRPFYRNAFWGARRMPGFPY